MPDAGSSAPPKSKAVAKTTKPEGGDTKVEGKKRFEVKKVRDTVSFASWKVLTCC